MKGCAYIGSKDVGSFFSFTDENIYDFTEARHRQKILHFMVAYATFIRYNTIVVYATVS